jgi:diadenosine tetraphosphate (Ap4A) HIT family hydrolase
MSELILASGDIAESRAYHLEQLARGDDPVGLVTAAANLLLTPATSDVWGSKLEVAIATRIGAMSLAQRENPKANDRLLMGIQNKKLFEGGNGNLLTRPLDPYLVTYSPIRGERPRGTASEKVDTISAEFNSDKFSYLDVKGEIYLRRNLGNSAVSFLINKFPFADQHSVIVPDIDQGLPQYLTQEHHELMMELMREAPEDTLVGYNSRGAYSSVNHLHFHLIQGHPETAVQKTLRSPDTYGMFPARLKKFEDPDESWEFISSEQHDRNMPYSLLYLPGGRVLLFPRLFQGSYDQPEWTSGFAFHEMNGTMITTKREDFDSIQPEDIPRAIDAASGNFTTAA